MIEESQLEKAINYLASTDETCARAKGLVKAIEYRLKVAKATEFLDASGTMAEKEAKSISSITYREMIDQYESAVIEFETIAAKRERAILTVDVWRTEQANRRQG